MSTINTNIADYLTQIETLTNTNLQILKTLNDSFFTKKNHIYTEVNDTTYVIPSFISLENKINMLQENFENLVKSPETCEAYFNFNGNTRSIEVRKYNHVPDSLTLPTVTTFNVDKNDIFKDFMTPVPYVNLSLPYIPNDIVEVNVKKIIPKSSELIELFKSKLSLNSASCNVTYANIYKLLLNYKEDLDYIDYDTIYKLPIRKNIGTSTYVIESVISDIIDDDLSEIITLKLRNDLKDNNFNNALTYKVFDETIERPLQPGDELINFDGTGKVEILEVRTSTNTIVVKVVNGEYLNFLGTDTYDTDSDKDIHDFSKLRFNAAIDFNSDKNIKIPLEEDQYIFVAVAALNSRMNVQSSWGTGLLIDTYNLKDEFNTKSFKTYYDANVKNLGDILFEMTSMITSPLTKLSQENFNSLTHIKPVLNNDSVAVMQINKHLNNSTTIKNIRESYNQKKNAESELNNINKRIADINEQLASISFDDITGTRTIYVSQLNELNNKKNELNTAINNAMSEISKFANNSELPIENAKYRIRGFYTPRFENIDNITVNDHVIGVKVQYRYKNISTELGNATSMTGENGETYIYSDWNNLNTFNREKIAECIDGNYIYKYESPNEIVNEPSYNQIDIPISQGETVDIRVKVVYDFGSPYITMTSEWSNIINVAFPEEFTKELPILTIINENNKEIESNRFNNILNNNGVTSHIDDVITDQNITYYHKPEHIASGFYTEERRIIPLKDKLMTLTNEISNIKNDIYNLNGNYIVRAVVGDTENIIYSDRENIVTLESYNNFINNDIDTAGIYSYDNGIVSTTINIMITNNSNDSTFKLYPLFPGNRDVLINNTKSSYVSKNNYSINTIVDGDIINNGVWFRYPGDEGGKLQTQNQFLTFRTNDAWTGESYYTISANPKDDNLQNATKKLFELDNTNNIGMIAYPYLSSALGLCIESDSNRSYMTINPGESVIVPIMCSYIVNETDKFIKKTISFDLRTSLYTDPINYSFTIVAKNSASIQDKLNNTNKKRFWNRITDNISKYNTIVK